MCELQTHNFKQQGYIWPIPDSSEWRHHDVFENQ